MICDIILRVLLPGRRHNPIYLYLSQIIACHLFLLPLILRFPPSSCRAAVSASGKRLRACLHLAQPRNMTKEGGDRVSRPKRYYILQFYPIISEVRLWQEVVNNPLACQDAFRDDWMGMWCVHVHQQRLHAPRLSDDNDGSCRSPPPPPPPPPLPTYDIAKNIAPDASASSWRGKPWGPKALMLINLIFLRRG